MTTPWTTPRPPRPTPAACLEPLTATHQGHWAGRGRGRCAGCEGGGAGRGRGCAGAGAGHRPESGVWAGRSPAKSRGDHVVQLVDLSMEENAPTILRAKSFGPAEPSLVAPPTVHHHSRGPTQRLDAHREIHAWRLARQPLVSPGESGQSFQTPYPRDRQSFWTPFP